MASVDGSKPKQDDGYLLEDWNCGDEGDKKEPKLFCPDCQGYGVCTCLELVFQELSTTTSHKNVPESSMPKEADNTTEEYIQREMKCSCSYTVSNKDTCITIYCKDHNEVMSVYCKTFHHDTCNSLPIDEVFDRNDTTVTKEWIKTLMAKYEELRQRRNEDAKNLTAKTAECRDTVEKFKRNSI